MPAQLRRLLLTSATESKALVGVLGIDLLAGQFLIDFAQTVGLYRVVSTTFPKDDERNKQLPLAVGRTIFSLLARSPAIFWPCAPPNFFAPAENALST
jgi:hypothetical protein